jgi:hypothetical protein
MFREQNKAVGEAACALLNIYPVTQTLHQTSVDDFKILSLFSRYKSEDKNA